jgi:hypothetical protein
MKPFTFLATVIFALAAMVQLARLFLAWPVIINGIAIPLWASVVLAAVAAGMSIMVWRENRPG